MCSISKETCLKNLKRDISHNTKALKSNLSLFFHHLKELYHSHQEKSKKFPMFAESLTLV